MSLADLARMLRTSAAGTALALAKYFDDRFTAIEDLTTAPLSDDAPEDVDAAAASAGTSDEASRADHKHDIATAAAVGLTSASSSAEGSGDDLALATHTHAITALDGRSMAAIADKAAGAVVGADFGPTLELLLTIPAGATGAVDFTTLPFKIRILDVVARKVTTSADAGDKGQLTTVGDVAISDELALNVSADELVRATSIAAATHEIAAAGTLRWARTQATNAACVVRVTCVRVS